MAKRTIDIWLGFGGVYAGENQRALKWASLFEVPMLVIALWMLLDWYLTSQNRMAAGTETLLNTVVWLFFVVETVLLTLLCNQRWRHLRRNWGNLVIIVLLLPPFEEPFGLFRLVRVFFLAGFLAHNFRIVTVVLTQNNLGKVLAVSALVITGGGVLIAGIDPGIQSAAEGIWWAWVTVTTVGYGDVVPVSREGRILASVLILMGICLVSLITANVSAYLLSRTTEKEIRYEQRELRKLLALEARIERMEQSLASIAQALAQQPSPPDAKAADTSATQSGKSDD